MVGPQIDQRAAALVQAYDPSLIVISERMEKLLPVVESSVRSALFGQTIPFTVRAFESMFRTSSDDPLWGGRATAFQAVMANTTRESLFNLAGLRHLWAKGSGPSLHAF